MDLNYEDMYHRIEEVHFWFRARRESVLSEIRSLGVSLEARILEVGCSGGPLLTDLKKVGFNCLFGIDISENAIKKAQDMGWDQTFVMDAAQLSFEDNMFDVVIASDVLEHIEDHEQAVREWHRVLKPGGYLLVYVPAFMSLWSDHDRVNHHFRRYTKEELNGVLLNQQFSILKSSYWNFFLYPLIYVVRRLTRNKKVSEHGDLKEPGIANYFLYMLLNLENKLLSFVRFPIGVSAYSICRK